MNEMLNVAKRSVLRKLLASVQCRLSILQVGNRPVQTKYAPVDLTDITSGSLYFTTPLLLPTHVKFTYSFELLFDQHSFYLIGSSIERLNEASPYHYLVNYSMNELEKSGMVAAVNQLMESAPTFVAKAIASYLSFCSYDQSIPRIPFQNN